MKKQGINVLLITVGLMSFFAVGGSQSQMITIPSQSINLNTNWPTSYSITKGRLAISINVPCNVFQRSPELVMSALQINQCTLHPLSLPSSFIGDTNAFINLWDKYTCSSEIDCCKPTCIRKLQRAMGDVPYTKIIGCNNGMIEIGFEALLDDVYARCGAPPDNGIASISVVRSMPTRTAHIPIHGRWFYTSSPASDKLRIGIDRLVISSSEQGKQPLLIDRTNMFASHDLPIKLLQRQDAKFAIHISAVLAEMTDDIRNYQGQCRFYAGSNFVEFDTIIRTARFQGSNDEWRWKVTGIEMQNKDIHMVNVVDDRFAPGVNGFSMTAKTFSTDLMGGDEFFTIMTTDGNIKFNEEIIDSFLLTINTRMASQVEDQQAPKRRDTDMLVIPEVRFAQEDRVRIITDPLAPLLRRAVVTLKSKIKSTQSYKVQPIIISETPSFVWYEELDAECSEIECDQYWQAVTEFVPEEQISKLTGSYIIGFDILECSPVDLTAVEQGRCHRSPYVGLRTTVKTVTPFEEIAETLLFKSQLAAKAVAPLNNLDPVNVGQRLRGKACLYDDLTGELDRSIDVEVTRIALVMMCNDGDTISYDMLVDGKPYDENDQVTQKLDAKMLLDPAPNGCTQYEFNVISVQGCPYMTLGFNYEVKSHIHGDNGKRDVHVTLQQTNGTQAVLVVQEGLNTGAVNLTLNSTNDFQAEVQFLWDDDDTNSTSSTSDILAIFSSSSSSSSGSSDTGSSSSSSSSSHHHKKTSKKVLVHFDSHGNVESRTTVESGSSSSSSTVAIWVACIIIAIVVIVLVSCCFFYPGIGYFGNSFTNMDDEQIENIFVRGTPGDNVDTKTVVKGDNNMVEQHSHYYNGAETRSQVKRRNATNQNEFPPWTPPANTTFPTKEPAAIQGFNLQAAMSDGLFNRNMNNVGGVHY